VIRDRTTRPVNVNFFCHRAPEVAPGALEAWERRLRTYFNELGIDAPEATPSPGRAPFDDALCDVIEEFTPPVVSFHFGLPPGPLVDRVRATGATILSSATSVAEARWLEDNGCDAVIAQGSRRAVTARCS
jgi:nitronate monooxygenase